MEQGDNEMKYNEFMDLVQQRARLDSEEEALREIDATLSTLSERISKNDAAQLAAQLPTEIQPSLKKNEPSKVFGLDEFYEKVARRVSFDDPNIVDHARAVISVVVEAVTPGEMDDVLAQLPTEYLPLFMFGSGSEYRKL